MTSGLNLGVWLGACPDTLSLQDPVAGSHQEHTHWRTARTDREQDPGGPRGVPYATWKPQH